MILVYFPDKKIHQYFLGFGSVETINGTLHIDGRDTTTTASDVLWKYIADQVLEQNEAGFAHDADYYEEYDPTPTDHELVMAMANILAAELNP